MTTCTICNHPEREQIDRLLSLPAVNLSHIAKLFSVHRTSVHRHRTSHLPGGNSERETLLEASDNQPFPSDPPPVDQPVPRSIVEVHPILEMVRSAQPSQVARRARESAAPEGGLPRFYETALTEIEKLDQDAAAIQAKAKDQRTELMALRERGRLLGIRLSYRELLARGSGELLDRAPVQINIEISFGGQQPITGPSLPAGEVIDIDPN